MVQRGYEVANLAAPRVREAMRYLNWKPAKVLELKELYEFLLARATEHGSPSLGFRLACERLASSRVVRPGVVKLVERVAAARAGGRAGDVRAGAASADDTADE
ncbi:DUF4158 domain-containing protein [Streptomyces monashensis]|uniref:DUF4158 domain-containing protein n=1 Tax=Streptomyces monashensis TaxID=1678012 RepID=UPI0033DF4B85